MVYLSYTRINIFNVSMLFHIIVGKEYLLDSEMSY